MGCAGVAVFHWTFRWVAQEKIPGPGLWMSCGHTVDGSALDLAVDRMIGASSVPTGEWMGVAKMATLCRSRLDYRRVSR